jgi:hypothetical protein
MTRPFDVPPRANHAGKLEAVVEVVIRRVWESLTKRMMFRDNGLQDAIIAVFQLNKYTKVVSISREDVI